MVGLLDDKGVFAYKTEAARYYKVSDVLDALDLKANVADADTRTIFDVDGLMTAGDIMRKVIPTCSYNGTGSQTDFKRLQQRPEETDGANETGEETLPAKLRETPAALQWQYGQDGNQLVAALEKFGIMTRMHKRELMLDVEAISDFSIFTKEQARQMWSTVKVVKDHRGQLYIPLGTFLLLLYSFHNRLLKCHVLHRCVRRIRQRKTICFRSVGVGYPRRRSRNLSIFTCTEAPLTKTSLSYDRFTSRGTFLIAACSSRPCIWSVS